jgi:hypothetical protein
MTTIFKEPVAYGRACVEHRTVTRAESALSGLHPGAFCPEGTYCVLRVDGCLWMSDTRLEHITNWEVVNEARGNVLIAGLGLGMILHPILEKKEVAHVTVVEKYADVIALVEPTIKSEKLTCIAADIYEWFPAKGTKYDCLYFDIWSEQSTDCLEEMKKLHLRFRSFKAKDGWMNSWRREELRAQKRRNDREDKRWGRY